MATRNTTTGYHPAPPNYNLAGKQNGHYGAAIVVVTASGTGVKPNMCCAPTTNGDRIKGLAASQPASSRSMKGMGARLSG
jgi:hypothetical protein